MIVPSRDPLGPLGQNHLLPKTGKLVLEASELPSHTEDLGEEWLTQATDSYILAEPASPCSSYYLLGLS